MKEKYLEFLSEYLYSTFLIHLYQWSDSQKETFWGPEKLIMEKHLRAEFLSKTYQSPAEKYKFDLS